MKPFFIGIAIVVVFLVLVPALWFLGTYNSMVTGNERVDTTRSKVETQYQRRFDLIPNLVASVQGILTQEQKVFGDIAKAREHYDNSKKGGTREEQIQASDEYGSVIGRLLVIMENYPQLRSYDQVRGLMDEVAGTENRVLVARDRYNEDVRDWNVSIKRFPRSILANMFGFKEKVRFGAVVGAEQVPKVELNKDVNTN